jgi:C-terminal processing protease CtpA/Prc
MKHFSKNTRLIGETTAGAENPVDDVVLQGGYILHIPTWQKIYSYDKSGWKGVGVKPNIEVESDIALNVAHMELLRKLKEESTEENIKNKYQWYIVGINALNNLVSIPENIMQSYGGNYGNRKIYYENDVLYYQYKGRMKRKMSAISNEYFLIDGYDFLRVKFVKDDKKVVGLNEIYDDGIITKLTKELK